MRSLPLHVLFQFIRKSKRNIFQSIINLRETSNLMSFPSDEMNKKILNNTKWWRIESENKMPGDVRKRILIPVEINVCYRLYWASANAPIEWFMLFVRFIWKCKYEMKNIWTKITKQNELNVCVLKWNNYTNLSNKLKF